jgi:hypothetical protein
LCIEMSPLRGLKGFKANVLPQRSRVGLRRCRRSAAKNLQTKVGFWFLVSGFWFLVSGFWFLVSGFWLLVSGFSPVACRRSAL